MRHFTCVLPDWPMFRLASRTLSRVITFPSCHHHKPSTHSATTLSSFYLSSSYGSLPSCSLDLCHSLLTAPLTRNLDAPSGLLGGSARDYTSRLAALLICLTLGLTLIPRLV